MHAVLIEVDVSGVDPRPRVQALREHIVPAITAMPGFQSGAWLTGNPDGKGLSLTVWDNEANAKTMADTFGPRSSPQANATVVRCEIRDVAATGLPPAGWRGGGSHELLFAVR